MNDELRYDDLACGQRELVDLMSQMGFGRIENLVIHRGQPVFRPSPRVLRDIKLEQSELDASIAARSTNYVLKCQVRSLLHRLTALGDGRVESITVANGLPLRMTVEAA